MEKQGQRAGSHNASTSSASSFNEATTGGSSATSTAPASPLLSKTSSSSMDVDNVSIFDLLDQFSLTTEISQKARAFTTKQTQKLKSRINLNDEDLTKLKSVMNKRVDKLYDNLSRTLKASRSEKLYYSISLYTIFFCGIIIGKHPDYFHILYTILFVFLMPIRILTYYKMDYGYYLMDLCYFVNMLVLLFLWVFPSSKMLFVSCFAFTNGTLSFAVITWRNSLVLHSVEKTTSSFIHILPPTVMYVITHQVSTDFKKERFPGAHKVTDWNFLYGILTTSLFYFIWQSFYHYFITIRKAKKIKAGKVTSFEHLRKSYSKTYIGKFVNSLPEPFPVVAFTMIQYSYQLVTMSFCPLLFKYKLLHSCFASFIFFMASYNGASYYIEVYGKKLEKEVLRLQQEIENLQSNNQGQLQTTVSSVSSSSDSSNTDETINVETPKDK